MKLYFYKSKFNKWEFNKMKRFFLHVIFPMVLGGIMYILFRSYDLLMFRWFEFFRIDGFIAGIRESSLQYKHFIPSSILFSLPDCLWVYSFTMYLSFYFRNLFIILIPCIGSVLTEICQLWFVPGTFDILDVLYMVAFSLLAIFFIYNKEEKNVKKEEN